MKTYLALLILLLITVTACSTATSDIVSSEPVQQIEATDTPTVTPTEETEVAQAIPGSTGWHLESEDFSGEPLTAIDHGRLSPDGRRIVYTKSAGKPFDRTDPTNEIDDWWESGFLIDVWTAELDENNRLQPPEFVGQVEHPGLGCGGGGESWADKLYKDHSSFFESYRMYWTANDTLIYPLNCERYSGYGRFDMNTGEMLPRIPGEMYNLTMSREKDRWFAITAPIYNDYGRPDPSTRHIITGVPTNTEYEEIPTTTSVDLLYVEPQDGRLYYTYRESIQSEDLSDLVGWSLGSQFHFFHTQLYSIQPDGQDETLHWEGDDHSYSKITRDNNGDLIFTLIENDTALLEAVQNGISEAEWHNYAPKVYIMRQTHPLEQPTIVREDTSAGEIWKPLSEQDE